MLQKNKNMKLTNKQALNKLLNILRKHGLIFKSSNDKIINHLLEYEYLTLKVRDDENSLAYLYLQVEHPDYNNLDYVSDYSHPHAGFADRINNALSEWEEKTQDAVLVS